MRYQNKWIEEFEKWIKKNHGLQLRMSPVNSMTPIVATRPDLQNDLLFIAVLDKFTYEPVKGRSILDTLPMGLKAYTEGDKLVFGFNINNQISLETEIFPEDIKPFLRTLKQQDKLTVAILDESSLDLIWITNNYPFYKVDDSLKPFYDHFL